VLLKVHRSNFQVTGFTADVAVVELAEMAHGRGIACVYDLGSGLLMNLSGWGLSGEPTVPEAVAAALTWSLQRRQALGARRPAFSSAAKPRLPRVAPDPSPARSAPTSSRWRGSRLPSHSIATRRWPFVKFRY